MDIATPKKLQMIGITRPITFSLEAAPSSKRQKTACADEEHAGLPTRSGVSVDKPPAVASSQDYEKFINSASQTRGSLRKLVRELPTFLDQPDVEIKVGLLELEALIASLRSHIHPFEAANIATTGGAAEATAKTEIPTADIVWVDQAEHLHMLIQDIIEAANENATDPCCYLDCEGRDLGRNGTVTVLSIYVPHASKVYIVDLLRLGSAAFSSSANGQRQLRSILEDSTVIKAMFDCRGDSDALYAHYQVKLGGILDIQLMEVVTRKSNSKNKILSMNACMNQRLKQQLSTDTLESFQELKNTGKDAMNTGAAFDQRPLPPRLLEYAAQDVLVLPLLHDHFVKHDLYTGEWPARVLDESKKRVEQACASDYDPKMLDMRKGPEAWISLTKAAKK